jgi:hypothetical protein
MPQELEFGNSPLFRHDFHINIKEGKAFEEQNFEQIANANNIMKRK